jgi:uncharacterized sulfatase
MKLRPLIMRVRFPLLKPFRSADSGNPVMRALRRMILFIPDFARESSVPVFFSLVIVMKNVLLCGIMMHRNHSGVQFSHALDWAAVHFYNYLPAALILCSVSFIFRGRGRIVSLFVIDAAVSALFIGDALYYRAFFALPTPVVFKQTANLDNLSASVAGISRAVDFLFIVDIPVLAGFAFLFRRRMRAFLRMPGAFIAAMSAVLLYLPALKAHMNGTEYFVYPRISLYDQSVTVYNLSPLYYHAYSVYDYRKNGAPVKASPSDAQRIEAWFDSKDENLPDNGFKGMFRGKNLIVIKAESLERFVVGARVNGREITPNINRMLGSSLDFPGMHEQVRDGNSSDGELMVNASVYPLRRGSTAFMYPYAPYRATLPGMLREYGYSTLAAHADHGSFWNWVTSFTNYGYEKCLDIGKFRNDDVLVFGLSDRSFLRQMVPVIENQPRPFLAYVSTMSSHIPFRLPDTYNTLPLPSYMKGTSLGDYLNAMHYLDAQIGYFAGLLREKGMLRDTVIAVFGDHEGVHKYYADMLEDLKPRESWWFDNGKRTVFFLYNEGMSPVSCSVTGGEVDILPTVAYLFGIPETRYERSTIGRNLLKTSRDFALLADGTVVGRDAAAYAGFARDGFEVSEKILRSSYFRQDE